jgi:FkbM family methyltransferase
MRAMFRIGRTAKRAVKSLANRMGFEIRRLTPAAEKATKPADGEMTRGGRSFAQNGRPGKQVARGALNLGEKTVAVYGFRDDPYFVGMTTNDLNADKLYSFARRNLARDSVCLDIGANIGLTALMLVEVASEGRVICVEPSPQNFPLLCENVKRQKNCELVKVALGNSEATVQFRQDRTTGAWDQIISSHHIAGADSANASVRQTTVDTLVASLHLSRLDFIKIDTEGSEYGILEGMRGTVVKYNPIVFMEFNSLTTICVGNRNPRDLLKLFLEIVPEGFFYGKTGELTPFANRSAAQEFIVRNLMERGCMDDIVGRKSWPELPK